MKVHYLETIIPQMILIYHIEIFKGTTLSARSINRRWTNTLIDIICTNIYDNY